MPMFMEVSGEGKDAGGQTGREPPRMYTEDLEDRVASKEPENRDLRIKVRNRRRIYLERHPEYFNGDNLELAGWYKSRCTSSSLATNILHRSTAL